MSDSSTCGCSGLEVDLSDQGLKRLERRDGIGVESLRLDNNQLQKLDNIDCYLDVWKLSVTNNQLTRMYYISKLHRLTHIDLSRNQILSIEVDPIFYWLVKHPIPPWEETSWSATDNIEKALLQHYDGWNAIHLLISWKENHCTEKTDSITKQLQPTATNKRLP